MCMWPLQFDLIWLGWLMNLYYVVTWLGVSGSAHSWIAGGVERICVCTTCSHYWCAPWLGSRPSPLFSLHQVFAHHLNLNLDRMELLFLRGRPGARIKWLRGQLKLPRGQHLVGFLHCHYIEFRLYNHAINIKFKCRDSEIIECFLNL